MNHQNAHKQISASEPLLDFAGIYLLINRIVQRVMDGFDYILMKGVTSAILQLTRCRRPQLQLELTMGGPSGVLS